MDLNRFVIARNIERYRSLLLRSADQAQTALIEKLVAEEQEKLERLNRTRQDPGDDRLVPAAGSGDIG